MRCSIFDKYECAASADGSRLVTGSYNNHFIIHHVPTNSNITLEALKDPPRRRGAGSPVPANETSAEVPNVNLMDFGKKALHVSYHPSQNVIAIAGLNKLYIYQALANAASS